MDCNHFFRLMNIVIILFQSRTNSKINSSYKKRKVLKKHLIFYLKRVLECGILVLRVFYILDVKTGKFWIHYNLVFVNKLSVVAIYYDNIIRGRSCYLMVKNILIRLAVSKLEWLKLALQLYNISIFCLPDFIIYI